MNLNLFFSDGINLCRTDFSERNDRSMINYEALFSDGTKEYRYPTEPKPGDTVRLRFRALKDSTRRVTLLINNERQEMRPEKTEAVDFGMECGKRLC